MKILFTGGSSFTGYWFIQKLVGCGHEVTAVFTRESSKAYAPERFKRIEGVEKIAKSYYGIKFGDPEFVELLADGGFDVLCHHAAEVSNYKNPDFDIAEAIKSNTKNIYQVFEVLTAAACKLVVTGSVFEDINKVQDNLPQKHYSGYGLSKSMSYELFLYYAKLFEVKIGKFVISNPFGAFEEKRFLNYLITGWINGETRSVNTPLYVRDNIHVELLADYYAYFIEKMATSVNPILTFAPTGYIETQGEFAVRVAKEMRSRLNKDCIVINNNQTDFSEPLSLFNGDTIKEIEENFDANKAWDDLANFYTN